MPVPAAKSDADAFAAWALPALVTLQTAHIAEWGRAFALPSLVSFPGDDGTNGRVDRLSAGGGRSKPRRKVRWTTLPTRDVRGVMTDPGVCRDGFATQPIATTQDGQTFYRPRDEGVPNEVDEDRTTWQDVFDEAGQTPPARYQFTASVVPWYTRTPTPTHGFKLILEVVANGRTVLHTREVGGLGAPSVAWRKARDLADEA